MKEKQGKFFLKTRHFYFENTKLYILDTMKKDLNVYDFNCVEKTNYVASALYPYSTKSNARRLLSHYIDKHPELQEELRSQGWEKSDIFIYRPQIRLILRSFNGNSSQ